MHYYGRYYGTALQPLLRRVNIYLRRWAGKKYRRLRTHKRFKRWWTTATPGSVGAGGCDAPGDPTFPTAAHLASWAEICPGHHESAGHQRSGRTRPGPKWLTEALTESAKAAARTRGTYFGAHFAQLRGRRGEPKAIGATRHDVLIAYYWIVRDQVPFRELGPDWLRRRCSPEHRARRLQQQLQAVGYKVTIE
jgi:hypothetical protein